MIKNVLNRLLKKLRGRPDKLLAGWFFHGSDYYGHYLVNKTFLMLAGIFDGVPKAARIPGAVVHSNNEDYIIYGGSTVRILDGKRRGILVNMTEVHEDEAIVKAGLIKQLELGRAADKMSDHRKGDSEFLMRLNDLANVADVSDDLVIPDMYIAIKPENTRQLRMRQKERPLDSDAVVNVVPGKILYPYSKCYGHGVCVAEDTDMLSPVWIEGEALESLANNYVRFNVLNYMKEF